MEVCIVAVDVYEQRRARVMNLHKMFLQIVDGKMSSNISMMLFSYIKDRLNTAFIYWHNYKLYLAFFKFCMDRLTVDNTALKSFISECWPDLARRVLTSPNVKDWVAKDVVEISKIENPVEQSRKLQEFLGKVEAM